MRRLGKHFAYAYGLEGSHAHELALTAAEMSRYSI